MRTNTLLAKLREGKATIGGLVGGYSPEIVELLGALRYDFVFLDGEHGSMSLSELENMVRACESYDITPIARIPNDHDSTILQFLDRGVQGIVIPHVNTAEQAARIARAARYHPLGTRGAAGGRAHAYNVAAGREQTMKFLNDQVLVIPMCEEVEAVKNLDEIVAVPGIDMIHCAANDLAQSMGFPGDAEVRKVMLDVIRRVRAGGKFCGVGGNSPKDPAGAVELIQAGAQFVTIPALGLLGVAAEGFLGRVREATASA